MKNNDSQSKWHIQTYKEINHENEHKHAFSSSFILHAELIKSYSLKSFSIQSKKKFVLNYNLFLLWHENLFHLWYIFHRFYCMH